jgi:hypothetical protein
VPDLTDTLSTQLYNNQRKPDMGGKKRRPAPYTPTRTPGSRQGDPLPLLLPKIGPSRFLPLDPLPVKPLVNQHLTPVRDLPLIAPPRRRKKAMGGGYGAEDK